MQKLRRLLQEGIKQLNTEISLHQLKTLKLCLISVCAYLSVRVLNCVLRGSQRSIPKFLMVRPPPPPPQDFKCFLGKLTNKMFPISYKVTFSVLFCIVKAEKTPLRLTLHYMGKIFNIRFGKIRFGIWRVTFLKSFFFIFTT